MDITTRSAKNRLLLLRQDRERLLKRAQAVRKRYRRLCVLHEKLRGPNPLSGLMETPGLEWLAFCDLGCLLGLAVILAGALLLGLLMLLNSAELHFVKRSFRRLLWQL